MKLQYASDLHLEFPQNKEFLRTNPIQAVGDVLLLAGDIVPFMEMDKHNDFFNYISDNFPVTYWIPGNHEYYNSDAANRSGIWNEKIRSNIFLVNNVSIIHDNVKLIFSTLWSKIRIVNHWQIERQISDFLVINHLGSRFNVIQFNQFHEDSLAFITKELMTKNTDKQVVITHHVPTSFNYPEKYKGDILNEAFVSEQFDLINANNPDYWIFGHHHCNFSNFEIGATKLRTNQLGYVANGEHYNFNSKAIIEV